MIPRAVRGELRGLSNGTPVVLELIEPVCFARVIDLPREAHERAAMRQRAWVGSTAQQANPQRHRGEAECLELALLSTPVLPIIAHDGDAIRDAIRERVPVLNAVDVALAFVGGGDYSVPDAWALYCSLLGAGLWAAGPVTDNSSGKARFETAAHWLCQGLQRRISSES